MANFRREPGVPCRNSTGVAAGIAIDAKSERAPVAEPQDLVGNARPSWPLPSPRSNSSTGGSDAATPVWRKPSAAIEGLCRAVMLGSVSRQMRA